MKEKKASIKYTPEDIPIHLHLDCRRPCRRLKRYPLQVRHKQDWCQGFILLLTQAIVDSRHGALRPRRDETLG